MTAIRLNHDTTLSREDLTTIASMIPAGSRILDLGCGSGRLLKFLIGFRHDGLIPLVKPIPFILI